jgi:hypothetical protein
MVAREAGQRRQLQHRATTPSDDKDDETALAWAEPSPPPPTLSASCIHSHRASSTHSPGQPSIGGDRESAARSAPQPVETLDIPQVDSSSSTSHLLGGQRQIFTPLTHSILELPRLQDPPSSETHSNIAPMLPLPALSSSPIHQPPMSAPAAPPSYPMIAEAQDMPGGYHQQATAGPTRLVRPRGKPSRSVRAPITDPLSRTQSLRYLSRFRWAQG